MSDVNPVVTRTFNAALLDHFDRHEREILRARFSDPLFVRFIEAQMKEAQDQMNELNPDGYGPEDAVKFLHAAKEARSIWQYWREFREFVVDWAQQASA